MFDIANYVKDRDDAMLDYPDTTKLEALVRKYPFCFSPQFKAMWGNAGPYVKTRTLEVMINEWAEAPVWLKTKVETAIAERRRT